jgi:hypothetical protein
MSLNFKRASIVAALAFSGFAHAAAGAFDTGNVLLAKMQDQTSMDYAYSLGFVTAIADSTNYEASAICLPTHRTKGQLWSVVKKYLEANPGNLHYSAYSLTFTALDQAFPCPTK